MPEYDYRCLKCGKPFSLELTITQHENRKIRCPYCSSTRVKQQLSTFFAQTSKKS